MHGRQSVGRKQHEIDAVTPISISLPVHPDSDFLGNVRRFSSRVATTSSSSRFSTITSVANAAVATTSRTSSSFSTTYANVTLISAQVVPSSSSTWSSNSNKHKNFPTAAIAVVAIVAGIVAIFVAYRLYVWCYKRFNWGQAKVVPYPETRSQGGGPGAGLPSPGLVSGAWVGAGSGAGSARMARNSSAGFSEAGWGAGGSGSVLYDKEKDAVPPSPGYYSPPPSVSGNHTPTSPDRNESPYSFNYNSSRGSLSGLINGSAAAGVGGLPRDRNSVGSFAGASTPRRSFYGNTYNGPQIRSLPSSNRLSGAPHNPHSRVDIVPPLPLAPPPGTVVATDKSTLDFSPLSGIGGGSGEDWFMNAATGQREHRASVQTNLSAMAQRNPAFDGDYYHTHPVASGSRSRDSTNGSLHGGSGGSRSTPESSVSNHSFPPVQRGSSSSSPLDGEFERLQHPSSFSEAPLPAVPSVASPLDRLQQRVANM
ncbi:hypothetical protein T439DRAFT_354314 [Meredithblackwellia eburnea MCA 4105]